MKSALIGHTGFVGGNLLQQMTFSDLFNSRNIETIRGRRFDRIVCAGARAEKWKANQNPAEDLRGIEMLMGALEHVQADEFILISTVDVYPSPIQVDEDSHADWAQATPYGRHRRQLETFITGRFRARVLRLPGLYGPGLKKNVIYDFLHNNQLDKIHSEARFQFYGLNRLSRDMDAISRADLRLVNLATEPVTVAEVARHAFGRSFDNHPTPTAAVYDMRTRHAAVLGGTGHYLESRQQVLSGIRTFVEGCAR